MAKGKNTTALFEVINREHSFARPPRQSVFTAVRRWIQSRPTRENAAPLMQSIEPQAPALPEPLAVEPEELDAVSAASFDAATDQLSAPPPLPRRGLILDSNRGEISLRLSYVSAGIVITALLTTMTTAFLVGQRFGGTRPAIAASTSEQLRQQPAQPNLTNLADVPRVAVSSTVGEWSEFLPGQHVAPNETAGQAQPLTRAIGLNYVIMQSYPEEETAEEARKLLVENGLDCTVERALPGWAGANWYSVVGMTGFDRLSSNPAYDAYLRKVREISDKFAKKGSFNAFDPKAYKWGKR